MTEYNGTVEIPLILTEIEAEDEEAAMAIADERVADAYGLIEEAIEGYRKAGIWPEGTHLGARYDDTEISES